MLQVRMAACAGPVQSPQGQQANGGYKSQMKKPGGPREWIKRGAGSVLALASPRLAYENAVFILAHMRCGSTALSNVLCSREEVSGYGETHTWYDGRGAVGRLAINLQLRGALHWPPQILFDKILHTHLHAQAPDAFFAARAVFMLREPEPTIRSIARLFAGKPNRQGWDTLAGAAAYYAERTRALAQVWDRFAPERRFALSHRRLLEDPEAALAALSGQLGFDPPLANSYASQKASRTGGGGDPVVSGQHSRIEPALLTAARPLDEMGLEEDLCRAVEDGYRQLRDRLAGQFSRFID